MVAISNLPIGQAIYSPAVAISSNAAVTAWDLASAQNAKYTAVENSTLQNPTNMKDGMKASLYFVQNGASAKTLAFGSAYQPSDNLPLVTTALGSVCYMEFYCDGTYMIVDKFAQNLVI